MLENVETRRIEDVRAKAHYLRSSSLIMGAHGVARLAARLEEAAIAGNGEPFDSLLNEVKIALQEVQAELTERLGSSVLPAGETAA